MLAGSVPIALPVYRPLTHYPDVAESVSETRTPGYQDRQVARGSLRPTSFGSMGRLGLILSSEIAQVLHSHSCP
jgi:hypothetical protein